MRASALMLGIVVIAVGCDKAAEKTPASAEPVLNLEANPDLLFRVFGERSAPRMMPVAAIQGNNLVSINLLDDGWHQLDSKYMAAGTAYPVFRDGFHAGSVTVTRGMWSGDPLYSLPGCASIMPMAEVTLGDSAKGNTIDQFATTRAAADRKRAPMMSLDSVRAIAKRIGYLVGGKAHLDSLYLDSLDFRAAAIQTRDSAKATILSSFIDPHGGEGGGKRGSVIGILVLADDDGTGYKPSYSHAVNTAAATAEYRSYVDHLDLTGDGIDEILLDGWKLGDRASLRVLAWRNGTWHESFVGRSSWCVDPPKKK